MRKVCAVFLASLMVYLSGCGGGGDDGGGGGSAPVQEQPEPAVSPLTFEIVEPVLADGIAEGTLSGENVSITYRFTQDGTLLEASYSSVVPAVAARVFYDPDTGLPTTILDEISGAWVSIRPFGDSRVDYWIYDADGSYQGGFGMFEEDGYYYLGDVVGIPARGGDAADGLTNIEAVSDEGILFIESLASAEAGVLSAGSPVVAQITFKGVLVTLVVGIGVVFLIKGGIALAAATTVTAALAAGPALAAGVIITLAGVTIVPLMVDYFTKIIKEGLSFKGLLSDAPNAGHAICHAAQPAGSGSDPTAVLADLFDSATSGSTDIDEQAQCGYEAWDGAQVFRVASLTDDVTPEPFSSDGPFSPGPVSDTSDTDSDDTPTVELVAPPTISK